MTNNDSPELCPFLKRAHVLDDECIYASLKSYFGAQKVEEWLKPPNDFDLKKMLLELKNFISWNIHYLENGAKGPVFPCGASFKYKKIIDQFEEWLNFRIKNRMWE